MQVHTNNPIDGLRHRWHSRLPMFIQSEAAECGLACLAMVSGFHGLKTDLITLRQRFSISTKGITLRQLVAMAEELHFSSRPVRVELEGIKSLQLPCIIHWDMNHFVVLKKVGRRWIDLHDPAVGIRRLSWSEFGKHFTGIALELAPGLQFKPANEARKLSISDLWSKSRGLKRSAGQILCVSLLLQAFVLAAPFYVQIVVDEVVQRGDIDFLVVVTVGFFLMLLMEVAITTFRSLMIVRLSSTLGVQVSSNLFRHLVSLPLDFFEKRHVGDVVSRFQSLERVRVFVSQDIIASLVDGLMAVLVLFVMVMYSLKLTLLCLLIVFIYSVLRMAFFGPARAVFEELIAAKATENSHFMESVRGVQTIKLLQAESGRCRQWLNKHVTATNFEIQSERWQITYAGMQRLLFGSENLLVIFFAAKMVTNGQFSIGMLFAFLGYKLQLVQRVDGLVSKLFEFKMLGVHLQRLGDIVYTPPESQFQFERLSSDEVSRGVVLGTSDIGYRYADGEPWIFRGVNIHVRRGETVAITGPSGCGKSTLLKCMIGLLSPSEGSIAVAPGMALNSGEFRGRIGSVMQDDVLMSGTIAENICGFESDPDFGRIEECARQAAIDQDIRMMPMQFNSFVGDMGSSLSGGQKQRLLLARALYREPEILFLDEATSALDNESERRVCECIKRLGEQKTIVMIAHRLSTLEQADRIVVIENGSVSSVGTHESLLSEDGYYKRLWMRGEAKGGLGFGSGEQLPAIGRDGVDESWALRLLENIAKD